MGTVLVLWIQVHPLQEYEVQSSVDRNIRIFGYTVILNLILRVAMYAISGVVMQGKVPSYAKPTP
jgi:hypothetical protein